MKGDRINNRLAYLGLVCDKKSQYGHFIHSHDTRSFLCHDIKDTKKWIIDIIKHSQEKIVAAGLAGFPNIEKLASWLWLKQDIVPHLFEKFYVADIQLARRICLQTANCYEDNDVAKVIFGKDRRVKVSFLADLANYKRYCTDEEFAELLELTRSYKERNSRFLFIGATAVGGGVSLMRHALMRLFKIIGVQAQWHVLSSKEEIFDITKKKFHNVLQAVAEPEVMLTKRDKEKYLTWIKNNIIILGPVIKKSDIVIVDDPQPSGIIPFIRKISPRSRIIYRSHIQIDTSALYLKNPQQTNTWNFLWQFIKLADVFVSHPVRDFVPPQVKARKLVFMSATTDPLDGLNKFIPKRLRSFYWELFDKILIETDQLPLDHKRPYVIQIARFDPSKGIPDLLEVYRKLRFLLERRGVKTRRMPQLIVAGNGSVDDPEGEPIYHQMREIVNMDSFSHIVNDIKIVRLPHMDQLLNVILSESLFAFQLSYKEGFEVKVTEALMKGKPVIAYKTGGIPLQIQHGKSGFLVNTHNTTKVAEYAARLFLDEKLRKYMSQQALKLASHEYQTISNASRWLMLAHQLTK